MIQTVAKARYLRVKAKKHRKLKAAKKASAPKNKGSKVEQEDEGSDEDDSGIDGNAEAGPSSPKPLDTVEETMEVDVPKVKKSKKDKGKGKVKDSEGEKVIAVEEEGEEDAIVPGGANDQDSAKEQRRADKRAKREARHLKRAEEAAAAEERERERDRTPPQLLSTQPANDSDYDSDDDSLDGGTDSDMDDILDDEMSRSLSGSPPPLEAFPLPTSAPAPDPSILSRQGLPAGITDATFIPQDLKLAIDELRVKRLNKLEPGLSEHMKARLAELDITEFFAVQAYMLPRLLSLQLVPWPTDPRNDFLISAPTGSGKTLAYCIPIIEMLSARLVTRLRALIVLPTRDLVVQVKETLEMLAKGTNLKVSPSQDSSRQWLIRRSELPVDSTRSSTSSVISLMTWTPSQ
jgi:ATP-dependent RNA helicase DDX51/DBP6